MRTLISYKNAWGIISAVALTMTFGCTPESFDEDLVDDQQIEAAASGGIAGISLPPKQGTSNNGMFSTSPLANIYTQKEVQDTVYWKKGIRISINPQTVADRTQWLNTQNMANWALQKGGYVIFGMWDSDQHDMGGDGHGDGLVDSPASAKAMWNTVAAVYRSNARVFFEVFNEPFGYRDPDLYMNAMRAIMPSSVSHNRIIVDGMGYADDVQKIRNRWDGLLGYHVYTFWLQGMLQTQSNYSNLVKGALAGVASRTFVTEFGANLKIAGDYNDSRNMDANIQFMKGMADAFSEIKPKGTFYWHGWNNGDTYSYWTGTSSAQAKVNSAQSY